MLVLFYFIMWTWLLAEPYNLRQEIEFYTEVSVSDDDKMIHQRSTSLFRWLEPPAVAQTRTEKYLAQKADSRRISWFDLAIATVILFDFVLTYIDSITKWWYVGSIELFLAALLFALLIGVRSMRPVLGRIMFAGLIAGACELFTDASGQQVVHSLIYPAGELTIWASPIYMPLTWMVTLTYLGYFSWRLRALQRWRMAILLCGLVGAIEIPLFEEMSYYGGWWRYAPVHLMVGHTPIYVSLFEGLVIAALPLLFYRVERRPWLQVAVVGVVIGAWTAISALAAWILLGH